MMQSSIFHVPLYVLYPEEKIKEKILNLMIKLFGPKNIFITPNTQNEKQGNGFYQFFFFKKVEKSSSFTSPHSSKYISCLECVTVINYSEM